MGFSKGFTLIFGVIQVVISLAMCGYGVYLEVEIGTIFAHLFMGLAGIMLLTGIFSLFTRWGCGKHIYFTLLVITTAVTAAQLICLYHFESEYLRMIKDSDVIKNKIEDNMLIAKIVTAIYLGFEVIALVCAAFFIYSDNKKTQVTNQHHHHYPAAGPMGGPPLPPPPPPMHRSNAAMV